MQETQLWGLFVSAFISSTVLPGGSEAILAYMVSKHTASVINLVTIATVGNTLGALTTWLLGTIASKKMPLEKLLTNDRQKSLIFVRKWGVWILLFSWVPVVGDGLCFAGGWLRLSLIPSSLLILTGKAFRYIFVAWVFS